MKESYGICRQTYIPLRASASEKAEMVSQMLFGELFTVIDTAPDRHFSLVHSTFDDYEGWMDSKSITPLDEESYQATRRQPGRVTTRPVQLLSAMKEAFWLSAGSNIRPSGGMINISGSLYRIPEEVAGAERTDIRSFLADTSQHFLNVPYLWGGRCSFGTDCSGMVQNLFKQAGIALPRDASLQAGKGRTLSFLSEARPGDLAYFDNEEGEIVHVGLILENGKIIHASGRVRIDSIDHQGIFSAGQGTYTHKLRLIKNVLD